MCLMSLLVGQGMPCPRLPAAGHRRLLSHLLCILREFRQEELECSAATRACCCFGPAFWGCGVRVLVAGKCPRFSPTWLRTKMAMRTRPAEANCLPYAPACKYVPQPFACKPCFAALRGSVFSLPDVPQFLVDEAL